MIKVYWDNNEKTIIRHDYAECWTWEDYQQAEETTRKMLDSVTYSVDVIINLGERGMLSNQAYANSQQFPNGTKNHPNAGIQIAVSDENFATGFNYLFSRLYPEMAANNQTRLVASLPEAYSMIREARVA